MSIHLQLRDIDNITPYVNNARMHSRKQIDQLKASIETNGFTNPILVDHAGVIIAGHGRLIAARELGLSSVPVIELASLNEAQVRALRLADNKIALNSGWDIDLLRLELGNLMSGEIEIDLASTGFSGGEIDVLLNPKADPDDDAIPCVRAKPRVSPGEIWELDEHRVGCGDGRDEAFVREVIGGGAQIDCAFLDPPYNVRIQGHANLKTKHREFAMASGEMSSVEFRTFLADSLGTCVEQSRDGAVHFVFMDWRHLDDLRAVSADLYEEQLNLCVWNKSNPGMGSLYRSKHELISVFRVSCQGGCAGCAAASNAAIRVTRSSQ